AAMVAELLDHRIDGRIKMFVTARALAARQRFREAFAGEYVPLRTAGERSDSVFAFARRHGSEYAITCVPRLLASVIPDGPGGIIGTEAPCPPLGAVWLDTRVELPDDAPTTFRNVLTGATIDVDRGGAGTPLTTIAAATLFAQLPVALLVAP